MAQEDYLSGSAFGQVYGSLLGKRNKENKKERNKALLATVLFETLGTLQKNQKQSIVDGANEVKDKYTDIFQNNQVLYELQSKNRAKYQSYVEDNDGYLQKEAIRLFNEHPNSQAEGIQYSDIRGLNPESKKHAMAEYARLREEAEATILKLGKNPAVSTATPTQYNALAKAEFKAALAQVEDDPYKQGLIKSAFAKIFGTGAKTQSELSKALSDAKELRVARENISVPSESIKTQDDKEIKDILNANNKAATDIKNTNPDFFDYINTEEDLKLKRTAFSSKINQSGYSYTLEDLNMAGELGTDLPGLPGFNKLMTEQRETLVGAAKKAREAYNSGIHPFAVLEGEEAVVYGLAIGTSLDTYKGQKIELELNELRLEALKNPEVDRLDLGETNKLINNENNIALAESQILSTAREKDLNLFNNISRKLPALEFSAMKSRVLITAEMLLREQGSKYRGSEAFNNALKDAVEIQLYGVYTAKEVMFDPLKNRNNLKHEAVDINDFRLLEADIETNDQAEMLVNRINKKQYMQNQTIEEDGKEITLVPDEIGKDFIDGNYRFFVIQVDENNPESLRWSWESITN
jgi:hypothetical protein